MGCVSSVPFTVNEKKGQDEIAVLFFDLLGLQAKEIDALYTMFLEIDLKNKGVISADDLIFKYRLEDCEFYQRLFSSGVNKNSKKLTFTDYVAIFWNFLSLNEGLLSSQAYYLFDDDQSDCLDFMEIKKMVETIHQKNYDTNHAIRKIVDGMQTQYAQVTKAQFRSVCKKNFNIVAPVASMQFNLRKKIIGDKFWSTISDRRDKNEKMSDIGFVYKCLKDCEVTREAQARELRLGVISKNKKNKGEVGRLERSSSSKGKVYVEDSGGGDHDDGISDAPASKLKRSKSAKISKDNDDTARKKSRPKSSKNIVMDDDCDGDDENVKHQSSNNMGCKRADNDGDDNDDASMEDGNNLKRSNSKKVITEDNDKRSKKSRPKSSKTRSNKDHSDAGGDKLKRGLSKKVVDEEYGAADTLSSKSKKSRPKSAKVAAAGGDENENEKVLERKPSKLEPIKKKSKSKKKSKPNDEQ